MEKKLKELGYIKYDLNHILYFKRIKGNVIHLAITDLESTHIVPGYTIYTQQEVNNIQEAFDTMKKDLEELKHYEYHK